MAEIEELKKKIFRKSESSMDSNVFWMSLVMQEFGYTLEEMKKMPIPTFQMLLEYLIEQNKKVNEGMKKPPAGRLRRR